MRRLPASLRREIATLSFLYRWTLPDCVLPAADTGYDEFGVELARLRHLRTEVVAFELLRPIYDHGGGRRPARKRMLASANVRAQALRSRRRSEPQPRRAAAMLFDDPAGFVERFASLLEAYWDALSPSEWERIEPRLAEGVELAGRQIAADGMHAFLLSLAPQLRVDPGGRSFGLDVPHDHRVVIDSASRCCSSRVSTSGRTSASTATRRGRSPSSYRAPHLVDGLRRRRRRSSSRS